MFIHRSGYSINTDYVKVPDYSRFLLIIFPVFLRFSILFFPILYKLDNLTL